MKVLSKIYVLLFILLLALTRSASACSSCTIHNMGKEGSIVRTESQDKRWYTQYLFEQKVWDEIDARAAHELHHQGHDAHDKTTEDFHHLTLGRMMNDDWDVFIEVPYVVRRFLEVDAHSILGSKQKSEGLGDLTLWNTYRWWEGDGQSLSVVGGIKFPTGGTKEKNTLGTLIEPELQPGTGSYDYILGSVYKRQAGRMTFVGNASYVIATEGDHGFEFGDTATVSFYADYLLNPSSETFNWRLGADAVYQYEQKQKSDGEKVNDSGGETLFLGPVIKLGVNENFSLWNTFLFPTSQDIGGVHQQLLFEWTAGGKIVW